LSGQVGSLEPGSFADRLRGIPLDDITALKRVDTVIKVGHREH
jgi:hypothetical protein